MPNKLFFIIALLILLAAGVIVLRQQKSAPASTTVSLTPSPLPSQPVISTSAAPFPTPTTTPAEVVPPIAQFKQRISKKIFGTYVTPSNSPVSPERFTGYHTGVDVEYGDVSTDVPVYAIADGIVVTSEYASGYGGVMVIKHEIKGQTLFAVYGHLRPGSLLATGSKVQQGQTIAVLGTAYSSETDGERRHLHFGIARSNTILGYVASQSILNATWVDPLSLY